MNPHDMAGLNKFGGISHPIMKSFLGGTVTYVYIYTHIYFNICIDAFGI